MDTFARNALRFTLAGAGIAVLATSFAGQASADEPDDQSTDAADSAGSLVPATDSIVPSAQLVDLPTLPAPEYLLSPSSLDSFVLPTVNDIAVPGLG